MNAILTVRYANRRIHFAIVGTPGTVSDFRRLGDDEMFLFHCQTRTRVNRENMERGNELPRRVSQKGHERIMMAANYSASAVCVCV